MLVAKFPIIARGVSLMFVLNNDPKLETHLCLTWLYAGLCRLRRLVYVYVCYPCRVCTVNLKIIVDTTLAGILSSFLVNLFLQ